MEIESNTRKRKRIINPYALFLGFVGAAVIVGGSFYGGVRFESSRRPAVSQATQTKQYNPNGTSGGFGAFRSRTGRVIGQVTAVSSSSISVQNMRTSTTETLSLTSATQVTDNGQSVAASDIQVGDIVFIMEDGSNMNQADRILVNPSVGGISPSSSASSTPAISAD